MEQFLKDYIFKWTQEKESLTAKYLNETGLKPSDICLVERETLTGRVFYPDLKSKYEPQTPESEKLNDGGAK
jgi:hypothetical protein